MRASFLTVALECSSSESSYIGRLPLEDDAPAADVAKLVTGRLPLDEDADAGRLDSRLSVKTLENVLEFSH